MFASFFTMTSEFEAVEEVLSMQIGADTILLAATLKFDPSVSAAEAERAQHELAEQIESSCPEIRRAFLRSSAV